MAESFEELLRKHRAAVERFIKFRVPPDEADDILQDVYFTAFKNFKSLKNTQSFKPWIIAIARNICRSHFRRGKQKWEPCNEAELADSRFGITEAFFVRDTVNALAENERNILHMYFWQDMPQSEISKALGVPLGTVKSRLHAAKRDFSIEYRQKGENKMKKLPDILPDYKIEKTDKPPFAVKWEELMGWFIVPREGESIAWGMYDFPSRKLTDICEMKVTGRASVHGIDGVEIEARQTCIEDGGTTEERTFVAQLTEEHSRYLATSFMQNGVRKIYTFLDGDEFLNNWGFGEDNCGNYIYPKHNGDIVRNGTAVTCKEKNFLLDIVGTYRVTIGGKSCDTVCVMDVSTYNDGVVSEQYLDKNGKTILWRRFNRDDWGFDRKGGVFGGGGKLWSERLPENERITVNGKTYVHWYDCITDYIL